MANEQVRAVACAELCRFLVSSDRRRFIRCACRRSFKNASLRVSN